MTKSRQEDVRLLEKIRRDEHLEPFLKELSRRAGEAGKMGDSREYFFNKIWWLLNDNV